LPATAQWFSAAYGERLTGVWKNVVQASAKVGGIWKTVTAAYIKNNGIWTKFL
jgi:hypothetical protein